MNPGDPERVLRELLAKNRRLYAPDYSGGLSNHLPMCLVSMTRLGATSDRLRAFAETYSTRLEPADDDWRALCGRVDVDPSTFWSNASSLMDGLGGAAFHGLLRLSFGLEVGDDPEELVHAIAYLRRENAPMGPSLSEGGDRQARDVLEAALALSLQAPKVRTITPRLIAIANDDRFAGVVRSLDVGEETLDQLARAALAAYVHTRAFTALHAFTATHALRAVLPWIEDPARAIRALFIPAAACLVEARPPRLDFEPSAAASWDVIARAAIASDDDHLAKFVFACSEEARLGGDDAALRSAAHGTIERGRS